MQLLVPYNLGGGGWRRICSPDIQSVGASAVYVSKSRSINRHLLTYLLTVRKKTGQTKLERDDWFMLIILRYCITFLLTSKQVPKASRLLSDAYPTLSPSLLASECDSDG